MKKNIKNLLLALLILPLAGCSSETTSTSGSTSGSSGPDKPEEPEIVNYVFNGGFESTDLSGWTVEYGDAFTDDSVSSRSTFTFKDDVMQSAISVNKTGNWYLSGKGYDLSYHNGRTGAIRSSNFFLTSDGQISLKIAGGATFTQPYIANIDGVDQWVYPNKNTQEVCFVAVYLAETDKMIAYQTNEFFLHHTEDYVDKNKYENGSYHTDNFCEYTIDLYEYAGQECYIRIVDNDKDVYYGYISVDDIRVGEADEQPAGNFFVKSKNYVTDVAAKDKYHIKNPGFETGSLGGWTIVSGDAFSHDGVNAESGWWDQYLPYNRDGNYHYGYYNPTGTGVLRSSVFELGGKGYISFKLGGCEHRDLAYIKVMAVNGGNPVEITRFSNEQFYNGQFPYIPMKEHFINMVQYYVDLHEYIGEDLYFEIVDEDTSHSDESCMVFDSFETYYTSTPYWSDKEYYEIDVHMGYEFEPDNQYQVKNGTFELGSLSYWTPSWSNDAGRIGLVTNKVNWWEDSGYILPFNKSGTYFFSGENDEAKTGTLTSSEFTVGGVGYMTFKMSGGKDPLSCYVSIIDASNEEELLRFSNFMFNDRGKERIGHGGHLMDMILYKADLTSLMGRNVKIRVVDNATEKWGLVCVDSFITYYETMDAISPEAILNANTLDYAEVVSTNQVLNGTFETGDFTGWTLSDEAHPILSINSSYTYWDECYLHNKAGSYFAGGFQNWNDDPVAEANTGTMTSSAFTLGGSGFVTYRLGGGKNKDLCHIEFVDASNDEVLTSTYNQLFNQITKKYYYMGQPKNLAEDGFYEANMAEYKVDLSAHLGKQIKIRIVDNDDKSANDWALLFVDDFRTYYENASSIPSSYVLAEQF